MKATKKITAILLCIAMLLGISATSAFALEIDDTVEWSIDGDYLAGTFIYGGTLKEGAQDLEGGRDYDTNSLCYEFAAEKDGYYKITVYASEIPWVGIADSYTSSTASGTLDYLWYGNETETDAERKDFCLYYLSKGTYLVGMDFSTENHAACEVRVDYIAESITDVTFDEKVTKDLIISEDVWEEEELHYFETDYTITFSNGEKLELDYDNSFSLIADLDKPWAEGENKLTIVLPGYEKEITATAYEITHFVKDIEIPNIDDYLVSYEWYSGYGYYKFGETEEDVIVTYTDGTKKTFNYFYDGENDIYNTDITLPNGREIHLYTYQESDEDTGKRIFYAGIAGHRYIEEECEIKKVSFANNLSELGENIERYFTWYINDFSWYIESLQYCDSIEEFLTRIGRIFGSDLFRNIGDEISDFINYYI